MLFHKNDFNNSNFSHITRSLTKPVKIVWFKMKNLLKFSRLSRASTKTFLKFWPLVLLSYRRLSYKKVCMPIPITSTPFFLKWWETQHRILLETSLSKTWLCSHFERKAHEQLMCGNEFNQRLLDPQKQNLSAFFSCMMLHKLFGIFSCCYDTSAEIICI